MESRAQNHIFNNLPRSHVDDWQPYCWQRPREISYKKTNHKNIYSACPEKRNQNVFHNISPKIWAIVIFWCVVSWINLPQNHVNFFHLTWIMSPHYLEKLKMLLAYVLPLSCQRKKPQTLFHLNCGQICQIRQIWIHLITECWKYSREGVQNTNHWSWNKTATENGVSQARSCHCSSHSSVASLIDPDQRCRPMFCTTSLAIFLHAITNRIQSWRIWR